ncbi:hypothetical protein EHS25_008838 [Saitozyma podzolica]|uniref:GH16 domain-containing protein n=1 Tax=Saitozyma podzolica TaxID=1890683 RepID=A0A427YMW1_9TREE|nr:hypothetical protein EHS25_008838 [Saitozyma podzolica]
MLALAALLVSPLVGATTYPLLESWSGSNFFNGFKNDPSTYDNTTNGDVFWAGTQNTSLLYVNDAGRVIMKVDNTTSVAYNDKRYAPKLLSKTSYEVGTVWVMDAVHMPYGCSVWPAFWTQGSNWPQGGEIDIMEGINLQTTDQIALHTEGTGCLASTATTSGSSLTYNNCSIGANSDSGCTYNVTNANSYGAGFAAAGGGVYVAEFASSGIKVWFLTRSAVPSSLTSSSSSLDTSTLGTPMAEYDSSGCDISQYFTSQTLTIDITLCGTWAGVASLLEETCPPLVGTNTCYTTYVINDAETTYANAYFEINYINVYSNSTTSAANSTSGSGASATKTNTIGASGTGSASASTSKSAGRSFKRWEGAGTGMGWVYIAGMAVLGGLVMVL